MKVLLVNPPLSRLKEVLNDYFPLGLGYLGGALRSKSVQAMIYNADKGSEEATFKSFDNLNRIKSHQKYIDALANNAHHVWKEIKKVFQDFQPDIVGISVMSTTQASALRVAAIAKESLPGCTVIFGGPHPTVMADEVLKYNPVDFVVRGEGEDTIVELVDTLQKSMNDFRAIDGLSFKKDGKIIHNKNRKLIEDLDRLPFPARDLVMQSELYISPNNRMNALVTSRGCPFSCTFCQSKVMWTRKVRFRSVENILAELEEIIKVYNPGKFTFWDDSFTINKRRVIELCRRLRERNIRFEEGWNCETRVDVVDEELLTEIKRAGCTEVFIGIESGSERILKEIKKDITVPQVLKAAQLLNKMGFIWGAFFMVGFPQETKEDIRLTMELMGKIKADRINLCVFTPYPGCELYDTVREMGLLPEDVDWSRLSHQSPDNYFSPKIPKDEFRELLLEVAEYTERLNNNPLISLRRAYHKKDLYMKNPHVFIRGLCRNLKLLLDNRRCHLQKSTPLRKQGQESRVKHGFPLSRE